jgi:hypothetical protein
VKLKEFYADPRRSASREIDFGSAWRHRGRGPWKVVWVEETGELVAFDEGGSLALGGVSPMGGNLLADVALGVVFDSALEGLMRLLRQHDSAARQRQAFCDEVACIVVEHDLSELRRVISGWEEHMSEDDGLGWLARRCGVAA